MKTVGEPNAINYAIMAQALKQYVALGYHYREVPWLVSREASLVTLPAEKSATTTQAGDLVGSAEQGFIELLLRGEKLEKACAITPCFREEETYDALHHRYFMKLELFHPKATPEVLAEVIRDAQSFFTQYADVRVIQTSPDSYDIETANSHIELGSYGIRQFIYKSKTHRFIYGTGVALPRLSTAARLYKS